MTYGSPLSQLHPRYFPRLFSSSDYKQLKDSLYQGSVGGIEATDWCNFYRLSDYIGKEVRSRSFGERGTASRGQRAT